MFKKLLMVSLVGILTACGGSDSGAEQQPVVESPSDGNSDSSTGDTGGTGGVESPSTSTIQTVNYLQSAVVCADLNNDLICSEDEELGKTDEFGFFELEDIYNEDVLIIKSAPNETYDLVDETSVNSSFVMYGLAGNKVVSAFTSLSYISNVTLYDISKLWGMDLELVSGDYIDALTNSVNTDAVILKAVSKLILSKNRNAADSYSLYEKLGYAIYDVRQAVENGEDISGIIFKQNLDGEVVTNLDKTFIEIPSFENMAGTWNWYGFGSERVSDSFARLTIEARLSASNTCKSSAKLQSSLQIRNEGCYMTSFLDNGGVSVTGGSLELLYGRTDENGTVLLFKSHVTVPGQSGRVDNGFVWMDNYQSDVLIGDSFESADWMSLTNYTLGYTDYMNFEQFSFTVTDDTNLVVETADKTLDGVYSFIDDVVYDNGLAFGNNAIQYTDSSDGSEHMYSVFRIEKFIALGVVEHDGLPYFSLMSSDKGLIEKIADGKLITGSAAGLSPYF